MASIKEYREFFLRNTKVYSGVKIDQEVGFKIKNSVTKPDGTIIEANNRFLDTDYPDEDVYKKLFESLTFKLNEEDNATEIGRGLVVISTDVKAKAGLNDQDITKVPTTLPSQLPITKEKEGVIFSSAFVGTTATDIMDVSIDGAVATRNEYQVGLTQTFADWLASTFTAIKVITDDLLNRVGIIEGDYTTQVDIDNSIAAALPSAISTDLIEDLIFEIGDVRYIKDISDFDAGTGLGNPATKRQNWALVSRKNTEHQTALGTIHQLDGHTLINTESVYGYGDNVGASTHTLNAIEMPIHAHTGTTNSDGEHTHSLPMASGTQATKVQWGGGKNEDDRDYAAADGIHTHDFTTGTAGLGGPHNNIQPSFAMYLIVKYK